MDNASRISSRFSEFTFPSLLINRSSDNERIWKQSAADSLVRLLKLVGMILTIQGATSYLSFQSVNGTIILRGSFPNELSLKTIAGLVFLFRLQL